MPTISKIQSFGLPVGSVVQTLPFTEVTAESYASTDSATPKTIISGTITPTVASHKILLFGFISISGLYSVYSGMYDYTGVRLKRGSTVIGEPTSNASLTTLFGADASGARPLHSAALDSGGYNASRPNSIPFHFMDSPNTTSATTYNVQGLLEHSSSTTMTRNAGGYNYNNDELANATCQLTLMEIVA
tara:strand:- start:15 stop:581 length:567 start_codon:yes stop_codon:yes gene_type:complete